jgi:hypothetical protein
LFEEFHDSIRFFRYVSEPFAHGLPCGKRVGRAPGETPNGLAQARLCQTPRQSVNTFFSGNRKIREPIGFRLAVGLRQLKIDAHIGEAIVQGTRNTFCGPYLQLMHNYEIGPRTHKRGVDLISDVLPFGRLWYDTPENAIGYAMHSSRSHDAVIRVYDPAGNVIETHEHKGDFREW